MAKKHDIKKRFKKVKLEYYENGKWKKYIDIINW
jgi:hypothetical protein